LQTHNEGIPRKSINSVIGFLSRSGADFVMRQNMLAINHSTTKMLQSDCEPPEKQRLALSGEDIIKLFSSQFSVSQGGSPALHYDNLGDEVELRIMLLSVQNTALLRYSIEL
jgi:hypothetical protein